MRRLALVFVLSVAPPAAAPAQETVATAAAPLVRELMELAEWCEAEGLRRERAVLLDTVVGLDPENRPAGEGLGYEKGPGGWTPPPDYEAPRRTDPKRLPRYREKLEVLVPAHRGAILAAVADASPRVRRRVLGALLKLDPASAVLREALGERRRGHRWVLEESEDALRRAKQLERAAKLLLEGVPRPAPGELTQEERSLTIGWTGCRVLDGVRVAGSAPTAELDEAARLSAAAMKVFTLAFRRPPEPYPEFTIYLLTGASDRDSFLHFHPRMTEESRRFAQGLNSAWLPGAREVGIWAFDSERRAEWVVRQTIAMLLESGFGLTTRHGALYEGLGLYLGHKLTGRRTTFFVGHTRYVKPGEISKTLLEGRKDWFNLAARRWRSDPPKLRDLLGRPLNSMTPVDILDSFVLAAFLIEGQPARTVEYLERLGRGVHFEEAWLQVRGLTVPELQERVRRWLRERRGR